MSSSSTTVNRRRTDWSGVFIYILMSAFALLMLMPLVYLASTAFKPLPELFLFPPRFFVMNPTMQSFIDLFAAAESSIVPFSRYVFNSVFVALIIVVAGVFISALAAYPLSKHKTMPFREPLFRLVIVALMFAPQITQIPQYIVMSRSGLMDTYFALILPPLAAPLGLFLMKQFLDVVPDALLEAARIDGAGEGRTFLWIVLPMLKPAIATMTLLTFISAWNDSGAAMLYTTTDQLKNLPYVISTISGGAGQVARVGAVAAASFLMIIPTLIMFIVTQRKVMETMAHSGIKA